MKLFLILLGLICLPLLFGDLPARADDEDFDLQDKADECANGKQVSCIPFAQEDGLNLSDINKTLGVDRKPFKPVFANDQERVQFLRNIMATCRRLEWDCKQTKKDLIAAAQPKKALLAKKRGKALQPNLPDCSKIPAGEKEDCELTRRQLIAEAIKKMGLLPAVENVGQQIDAKVPATAPGVNLGGRAD